MEHLLAALKQHIEHQADEGLLQGWDADQQVQQALALPAHAGSPIHGREQQASQLHSHTHISYHRVSMCTVQTANSSVQGSVGGKPLYIQLTALVWMWIMKWTGTPRWLSCLGPLMQYADCWRMIGSVINGQQK